MTRELVEQLIAYIQTNVWQDTTPQYCLSTQTIHLKPTLTLLYSEFYELKSIITRKLCKGNFFFIIYDEWLSNVTKSQKFRPSFKTNIQTKAINWTSGHVFCYIILSQYVCFFLFSMFHHSSGCFVCNAMIAVTYQSGNGSFLTMNEPLKSRLNWRPVCFLYLKGKMLQGRLCGQIDQVHLLDFSLKIFCLEHSIYLRTP